MSRFGTGASTFFCILFLCQEKKRKSGFWAENPTSFLMQIDKRKSKYSANIQNKTITKIEYPQKKRFFFASNETKKPPVFLPEAFE